MRAIRKFRPFGPLRGRRIRTLSRGAARFEAVESRMLLAAPVVDTFTSDPASPVAAGVRATLSATAHDPDAGDTVTAIRFYEDKNVNGQSDDGELIDSDLDNSDGWSIIWDTKGRNESTVALLAVAEDTSKTPSVPATLIMVLTVNHAPVLDTFSSDPTSPLVVGQVAMLTASARDPDTGDEVTAVRFYDDSNTNGQPDSGELIDSDLDGSDGWSTSWLTKDHSTGSVTLLAIAEDSSKTPSDPKPLTLALNPAPTNHAPVVNTFAVSPQSPILVGDLATLIASATDSDLEDAVTAVRFYDDANADQQPDDGELLNSALDGSDGWSILWSTAGHGTGSVTLLAVAEDNSKTPSPVRLLTVAINPRPLTINGTTGNDVITITRSGSSYAVSVNRRARNYRISQAGGFIVNGLDGNDTITLATGVLSSSIFGGNGNDTLTGGDGNDVIRGGAGDDRIDGGDANDSIYGEDGNDILLGGNGNDRISGGRGDDQIYGGAGNNQLNGDDGNDVFFALTRLKDTIFGGRGRDTAHRDLIDELHDIETADVLRR
jgi:Ca2+-binding RTX toxin-like protein